MTRAAYEMQPAETYERAAESLPAWGRILGAVAILLFLAWGWMLFSAPGNTLHSVDNVRDFRVALGIATGDAFPSVSQPFAASRQLPPLFFYTIAVPLFVWHSEFAVFVFTAFAVLLSVGFLALGVYRRFGAVAAIAYLAFALPPHGSVVFQGVSNPALAFVCVNVLLASYVWSASARAWLLVGVVASAWAAPQMHPSAFFIAAFVLLASLCVHFRAWLRPLPAVVVSLLGSITLIWIVRYGVVAPEAQGLTSPSNDSVLSSALHRLLSMEQWSALWSTPWTHVRAISGLPGWTSNIAVLLPWIVLSLSLAGLGRLLWRGDLPMRALALAVIANAICVTAALDGWGLWYVDASWPPIALCAAIGAGALVRAAWTERAALMLATLAMVLPFTVFFLTQARGEYAIRSDGLFLPAREPGALLHVPTARTVADLRALIGERAACDPSRVVGIDESYLRDMTLRTLFLDGCRSHSRALGAAAVAPERLLIRREQSELPTPPRPQDGVAKIGPYRIYVLPQRVVTVNGNRSAAVWGTAQGSRYGFFAVQGLPKAAIIEAEVNPGEALYVGFRCNALNGSQLRSLIDTESTIELLSEKALPPFAYTELRLAQVSDQASVLRLISRSDLPCDASAWVM